MKRSILQSKFNLLLVVLLLVSCSQDEFADKQDTLLPEGVYPLEIASVTLDVEGSEQPWGADAPQTRVSENETGNGSVWNDDDQINVQIGDGTPGTYSVNTSGNITAVTPAYWQNTQTATVTAWYPDNGTIPLSDQSNGLAYVLAGSGTGNYQNAVSITFTHALSKIRVKLEGDKADDVHTVQVKSCTQCTHNKGTVSGSDEGWITLKKCTYNNETCWEANVVPDYEITEIQLNGNTPCTLTSNVMPVGGSCHEITIDVKQATLKPVDGKFTVNGGNVLIKDHNGTEPIVVNGTATITLDNVQLTTDGTAMEINNGATVTLNVKGTSNSLTSTNGSGIGAHEGSSIIIKGESINNSKLTVSSGKDRNVGIGFITNTGGGTFSYGNIEIANVTLSVEGGDSGAAIGTTGAVNTFSNQLVCGDITINNSNVTANSKNANACIGTSSWSVNQSLTWDVISIMNSTIKAKSEGNGYGDYAACIGMGYVGLGSVTIKKIEIKKSTLSLSTDANYKVGKGTIKGGTVTITDGIYVDGNNQGNDGWNP